MSSSSPFIYFLQCSDCGLRGEIEEYTETYVCPSCGGTMHLVEVCLAEKTQKSEAILEQLILARENGDILAKRQLAYLADSSDIKVRDCVEQAHYHRRCKKLGSSMPAKPLTPRQSRQIAKDNLFNDESHVLEQKRQKTQQYCKQNDADAVKWVRKAAKQGDANAQKILGNCYYFGRELNQNYAEAVKWFRKAAKQGNADAQKMLGDCYYCGIGVKQNNTEAVKWMRKAAKNGNEEALEFLQVWGYISS